MFAIHTCSNFEKNHNNSIITFVNLFVIKHIQKFLDSTIEASNAKEIDVTNKILVIFIFIRILIAFSMTSFKLTTPFLLQYALIISFNQLMYLELNQ